MGSCKIAPHPNSMTVPAGTVVNGAPLAAASDLASICCPGEAAVDRHSFGLLGVSDRV